MLTLFIIFEVLAIIALLLGIIKHLIKFAIGAAVFWTIVTFILVFVCIL